MLGSVRGVPGNRHSYRDHFVTLLDPGETTAITVSLGRQKGARTRKQLLGVDHKKGEKDIMKILVTGGAGFIGTNLCNELRSRGNDVIACDLYNTDRDDYIRCDARNFWIPA